MSKEPLPGCLPLGFAVVFSLFTVSLLCLILLDIAAESKPFSAAVHVSALMLPFIYAAAAFWCWWYHARWVARNATGIALIHPTETGAEVYIRTLLRRLLGGAVFATIVFTTALIPHLLLGRRNPAWVWAIAAPVALSAATACRPWRAYRLAATIDDWKRTITLRPVWGKPVTLPWDAVIQIAVVRHEGDESEDQHYCEVRYRTGATDGMVALGYSSDPEPVERCATWLREHIQRNVQAPLSSKPFTGGRH